MKKFKNELIRALEGMREEMDKTVKNIVISPEGIDIISVSNGVSNVTQISLEPEAEETKEILEKYSLSDLKFYPVDMNIVRGLADSQEQLIDYLETTRRLSNSKQKVDIPESMPKVTYDLKELKNSFEQIGDENLRKSKQMALYNQAKQTQSLFKGTKIVAFKMGTIDRGYFAVQTLLQNRNKGNEIKALNPGIVESSRNLRRELYNPEYTAKTNEAAREFSAEQSKEIEPIKENEEIMVK